MHIGDGGYIATMATELLSVPEEHVPDVIAVIRAGLSLIEVPALVKEALNTWCDEHEAYIGGGDDGPATPAG